MIRADLELSLLHWLMVLLAVATGAIHLYVGLTEGRLEFVILGGVLIGGLVLFFTDLFAPVLYFVGALFVGILLVVWVLEGATIGGIEVLDKVVQVALIAVFLALLFREEGVEPGGS